MHMQLSPQLMNAVAGKYTINIKGILQEAWHKVSGVKKPFWGGLSWTMLVLMPLYMLAQQRSYFIPDNYFKDIIDTVLNGVCVVFSDLFFVSLIFLTFCHLTQKVVSANLVFAFRTVWKRLVLLSLFSLLLYWGFDYFSPSVLTSSGTGEIKTTLELSEILWLILYILICLYMRLVFYMAMLLVLERKLMPMMALKTAFIALIRHFFKNFALDICATLISIVGSVITLGIGAIWVLPMAYNITAIQYQRIFGIEQTQN